MFFAFVLLLIRFCFSFETNLGVLTANDLSSNQTIYIPTIFSDFTQLPSHGLSGFVYFTDFDFCHNTTLENVSEYFLILPRGNCSFYTKISNAYQIGFKAVIVYNSPIEEVTNNQTKNYAKMPTSLSDYYDLVLMTTSSDQSVPLVASFISYESMLEIKYLTEFYEKMNQTLAMNLYSLQSDHNLIWMVNDKNGWTQEIVTALVFALVLTSVCGFISLLTLIYAKYRIYVDRRRFEIKNRLTEKELNLIPLKEIKTKEDESLTCAICLDDLTEGQQVRDLPCSHVFHKDCVDDWFLKKHRNCPTCRQDVTKKLMKPRSELKKEEAIINEEEEIQKSNEMLVEKSEENFLISEEKELDTDRQ